MEQNVSCSRSSWLRGSASSSHFDGHGDYKHTVFPSWAGGKDELVCFPGDDRPWGFANKSGDDPTGNKPGKGREKVVTGTPGLLFLPSLLSLPIVFSCGCNHENVTRPQLKVNGKWLKSDAFSGCSLAWAIIVPPSKPSFPEIISHSFYPLSTKSNLFVPENLTEMCCSKALTTCPFTNW